MEIRYLYSTITGMVLFEASVASLQPLGETGIPGPATVTLEAPRTCGVRFTFDI